MTKYTPVTRSVISSLSVPYIYIYILYHVRPHVSRYRHRRARHPPSWTVLTLPNFSTRRPQYRPRGSIYLKILFGGCLAMVIVMFCIFSIYWGALWKIPAHNLHGWVVDFDGSTVGNTVAQGLTAGSSSSKVTFTQVSASEFPGGWQEVANKVVEQKTWVAVVGM